MNTLDILYNDKNTDIILGDVTFHSVLLSSIPYFKGVLSGVFADDKDFIDYDVIGFKNANSLVIFKKWLYGQTINKKELDVETIVCIYNVSDYMDINFYKDLKGQIILYLLNATPKEQFEAFLKVKIYDMRFKFPQDLIDKLPPNSFQYAMCVYSDLIEGKESALSLFENLWKTSNGLDSDSYYMFALCLSHIDDKTPQFQAFNMFKKGWEKHRNDKCLHKLAYCYEQGRGCNRDEGKAYELYELSWKENKNFDSYRELTIIQNKHNIFDTPFECLNTFYTIWKNYADISSLFEMSHILSDTSQTQIDFTKDYIRRLIEDEMAKINT